MTALTATIAYVPDHTLTAIMIVAFVYCAISLPSLSVWTVLSQQMAGILSNPRRLLVFNWAMAGLLVASLYSVLWP